MSQRNRSLRTKNKRTCLSPIAQMEAERRTMKMAVKKYPNDPQKAKVESQIILLGIMGQRGNTFGR